MKSALAVMLISLIAGMLWGIDLNQELNYIAYKTEFERNHPGYRVWGSQTFMECQCANLAQVIGRAIYQTSTNIRSEITGNGVTPK